MTVINRSTLNQMATEVLDEETHMTALDYWEWSHSYDDIYIVEDEPDQVN